MSKTTDKIKSRVKSIKPEYVFGVLVGVAVVVSTHKGQTAIVTAYTNDLATRTELMAKHLDIVTQNVIDRMPPIPTA